MAKTKLTIEIEHTDPEPGAWCPHCALSSASSVTVYQLSKTGVRTIGIVTYCPECGEYERSSEDQQ